jgi:predicted site-specific integrase-resolvase
VNLKEWAAANGVGYSTARQWFLDGKLPVPARRVGGLILTSMCARLYGRRAAANRARRAVAAATEVSG